MLIYNIFYMEERFRQYVMIYQTFPYLHRGSSTVYWQGK